MSMTFRGNSAGVAGDVQGVSSMNLHVSGAALPLSLVHEGDTVEVGRVSGTTELRQHLAELGFVVGTQVKVVSRVNGDVIVSVKGATFGIGRDMAKRIMCA
ncbi:MAG: FeoA family protein [Atopobiaceae bacterium]|jgi:ferrous iron transport protein A